MNYKGLKELKNAMSQIENDLIHIKQKIPEEKSLSTDINSMLSFLRINEINIEKTLSNENTSKDPNYSEAEICLRFYKEIFQQIFNGTFCNVSIQELQKNSINGGSWNNTSGFGIEMSSSNSNLIDSYKNPYRTGLTQHKLNGNQTDVLTMHGAGDTLPIRRSKVYTQPEKDIEEIQQTISMQLKLQQHHSRHRYKFQSTQRSWPITPEINVVFQGNNPTNQYQLQNTIFTTNADNSLFTSNNVIGLQNQFSSPTTLASHILSQSLNPTTAFYGYANGFHNSVTNPTVIQTDSEYAQLPSSILGFLNTNTNKLGDSIDQIPNQNSNYFVKAIDNQFSSNSESHCNLIDYQIKTSTLTWDDLANVAASSSN